MWSDTCARAAELDTARQQAEHWALLEALARHDPEAAERIIATHLRQAPDALGSPAETGARR